MLAHKNSEAFINSFIEQWLDLTHLEDRPKLMSTQTYKDLAPSMLKETQTFFKHILDNNLPVTELISADYSFMNRGLASYYGINQSGLLDDTFTKVNYPDNNRRGLITHASYLSSGHHPGTSIIFRGCLLYTSPSPRDLSTSRMPSSA